MGKVIIDISISLDGYISGANDSPTNGLGDSGDRLHEWYLSATDEDSALIENSEKNLGALILGRRTYDNSVPYWGPGKGPSGDTPVVVVSHDGPDENAGDGTPFTFVKSIEEGLEAARKLAGDQDIRVMGGANVPQQFLKAGLVDEVTLHMVPALLGGGQRLYDTLGPDVVLEQATVIPSVAATHLTYRVVH